MVCYINYYFLKLKLPQHELTIAIIHPTLAINQNIQQTIQSRLAATGFKIINQQTINSNNINPQLLTQNLRLILPTNTTSIIYLLSRSRAIQAWKDLVGINPDLPARPGSLSFIFGTHAIWATEKLELIYEIIRLIWPHSPHLYHPMFNQITLPEQPTQPTLPPPPPPPNKAQKRVFRFSQKPQSSTVPITTTTVATSDRRAETHSLVTQQDSHLIIVQPNQPEEETIKKLTPKRTPNSSFSSISPSVFSHPSGLSYAPAVTTTTATPTSTATDTAALNTTSPATVNPSTSTSPTSEPLSSSHSSLQPPINIDPSSPNSSSSSIDSTTSSNRPMETEQSLPQSGGSSKADD
ncbi:hypothetical protein VP01_413g1 [Puccinia sorghi]|uniref:Nucleoside diphosphate kinase n=1 Tax=Puccinia sorghi TaxID=27349 RepID=A0A0L6URY6_9BASI|nr:hypothetical protein VP01_413g1 [Puccinia sorghi]